MNRISVFVRRQRNLENSCNDERFFELPLVEKRTVYRRRFAMLEEIDAAIFENLQAFRKED